jgi:hypothetical protein
MRALLFVAAVLFVALPAPVWAQQQAELPPVERNHVLSANLLGIVAKWINVEYERKASSATTAGLSASSFFIGEGDGSMRRTNAFVRFYPQRAALDGLYIGVRAGVVWNRPTGGNGSAVTAGAEVGRTWLYGPEKNIAFSVGFGLDRAWYDGDSVVIPNIRLFNGGIAF